ncbi:MAG: biopolymer transporter ExbD [Flavobacteriia bacterium]|nr:biopolymer transporter ExbD [Flavobacteriia bacterium]
MPKIKIPKSSPSIDMTPMVDLAFLLVTFFMLTAEQRQPELVAIDTPYSIEKKEIPENYVIVEIDKNGRKFVNISSPELKKQVIGEMMNRYKFSLTEKQMEQFNKLSSVGCDIKVLPQFLSADEKQRNEIIKGGIPTDSLNNQLREWIKFSHNHGVAVGKTLYDNDFKDNKKNLDPANYELKFILKADNKALYLYAKDVIETFRDLELTNLNFVTSLQGKEE